VDTPGESDDHVAGGWRILRCLVDRLECISSTCGGRQMSDVSIVGLGARHGARICEAEDVRVDGFSSMLAGLRCSALTFRRTRTLTGSRWSTPTSGCITIAFSRP
jgi:hypothetical protein